MENMLTIVAQFCYNKNWYLGSCDYIHLACTAQMKDNDRSQPGQNVHLNGKKIKKK